MNAIKQIVQKSKLSQKEISERMGIKENTFSHRINKEVKGTIEWSIEVAKELNVKSYSIVKDGYVVKVKIK